MSFSEFYAAYPRKEGKPQAEKAYNAAVKKFSHEIIMASLKVMQSTRWRGREQEAISKGLHKNSLYPLPATFLNGQDHEEIGGNKRGDLFDERAEAIEDELPFRADCVHYGTAKWEEEQKRLDAIAAPYRKARQATVHPFVLKSS